MKRMFAAALAIGILAGSAPPVLAIDGHGNAENPERAAPNTGSVSGGPTHRDDPRVRETQEVGRGGQPAHFENDGHAHGHSHGRK